MNLRGMKDWRPAVSGYALLGLLVLLVKPHSSQGAVPDFTCFNSRLYAYAVDQLFHFIGGYKSGDETDAVVSFERVLDTGSGSNLPTGGYEEVHPDLSVSAIRYIMYNSIGADIFGAYTCIFTSSQDQVKITTVILLENGDVSPASSTLTTSAGEDVTLTVTQHYGLPPELRWRHNGDNVTAWNGQSSISILNVQLHDAGIYECYIEGRHDQHNHALMNLLVRHCSPNKWGLSCDNDCSFCYNGGQCDDTTGDCICAPGFSGVLCRSVHNNNCFGQDCDIRCTHDWDVGCVNNLMCLPDPFGCTCAAGFTGINCEQNCPHGMYGAGCSLECRCVNSACNNTVGTCTPDSNCRYRFTGVNCEDCSDGWFGVNCAMECHCADGGACDRLSGACRTGVLCQGGFRGENCQNSCPYGQIGINPNCKLCYVPVSVIYHVSSEQYPSRTITWKAPQNKCPVIDYAVQYQLVKRILCQEEAGEFQTLHNTTERQSPLSHPDSLPNAIYKVRVLAKNEAGLGEFQGNIYIDYTTPAKEPTGSPTNFKTTSSTKHSVALSWSEIPCGQRNGVITKYRLSYRVLEKPYDANFSPTNSFETVDIEPSDMHRNISGLEPSTKYDFLLEGFNSVGVGEKTIMDTFTAVETDLSAPTQLSKNDISHLTSSTVTIAVNLPSSSKYITGIQIGVRRIRTVTRRDTMGSTAPAIDYVAAEIHKTDLPATFTVGDGETLGNNVNKPLESNTLYDIYLGSVSRTSQSTYAVKWSEPLRVQVPQSEIPLVAAIVGPLMLLVVICVISALIFKKRRKRTLNRSSGEVIVVTAGMRVLSNDNLSSGLEHPTSDVTYDVIADTTMSTARATAPAISPATSPATAPATTPATAPANSPATSQATAPANSPATSPATASATAPARPKILVKKKQFTAPIPILLSEFDDYVSKKKKETYKKGNGFLFDYENLNLVTNIPNPDIFKGGWLPDNVKKNRFPGKLPVDLYRPQLMTSGKHGYNNHINACFLNSPSYKGQYVTTSMPLSHTISDMWRMVYDYKSTCIVMLNTLEKKDHYWPERDSASYGNLTVTLQSTDKVGPNIIIRYLYLANKDNQESRLICHLQLLNWPVGGIPSSPKSIVELVTAVKEWQLEHKDDRITIQCIDGEGVSGTFCALLNVIERLEVENKVDVFQTVQKLRVSCHGLVQSQEQYEFIYEALQMYLGVNALYANL
ncbi:receptor-type tyrosine-protein phosphatase T-like isoform X1 [Asterias rubens]|uniref:receptor-type tyrosine-protein phosphatase T-like isoform X1 n=1 Tax=Asterias rubens TaxID=7604 RepID=UPI00145520B7|nr:receptor-type tyrosine-protein phosphatase T-like isoform X1 [Asterias rubens]